MTTGDRLLSRSLDVAITTFLMRWLLVVACGLHNPIEIPFMLAVFYVGLREQIVHGVVQRLKEEEPQ